MGSMIISTSNMAASASETEDGARRTRAPLQNRVDPFGALHATPARGALMGNRGGRFHCADRTLGARRWSSRRWIACLCNFRGRRREVWGEGYTELFFLDEATALAAGHRPCFECRRENARAFRDAALGPSASADEIDSILHRERLDAAGRKRLHRVGRDELCDGAMIALDGAAHIWRGEAVLRWSFEGYGAAQAAPPFAFFDAITPPLSLAALRRGYSAAA